MYTIMYNLSSVLSSILSVLHVYGWYLRHLERQVVIAGAREIPYNYNTPKLTETAPFF